MSTLTIRNLPPGVVERLKLRARRNGNSMEQEVRDILGGSLVSRDEILDRIEARQASWPSRPSAEKVRQWVESSRRREHRSSGVSVAAKH